MSANVFTYGSLMFAEVWQPLVSGRYPSGPAVLAGYRRFAVPGVTYPGIVAAPGQEVAGLLYRDVAPDDLARLDLFEGA
ncbi:MAG TPA: gamma-glutamylcyclotransferase family protein, partial [Noviherbaspirillum sp.]